MIGLALLWNGNGPALKRMVDGNDDFRSAYAPLHPNEFGVATKGCSKCWVCGENFGLPWYLMWYLGDTYRGPFCND